MSVLNEFLATVLFAAVLGWLASNWQVIITLIFTRKLNLKGSGGMPSAHHRWFVLTITTARFYGVDTPSFALAVMFAFVTMYDAMGVRRETGEHARLLNKYLNELEISKADDDGDAIPDKKVDEIELKEFIGHTPLEVLGGALLGI